jgi:SecD/SecF fusion protein
LSQYVIGLGAYDTEASTETTSYTNVIPHINPSTGKSDGKYQYVVAKMPNRSDANELLDGIQNTTFTLPSVAINNADLYFNNSALTEDKGTIANMRNQTVEQGQTLQPTIFGFSPLIGILISLCFIILAIGILVSVLYRGPGAFGCFAMVASFGVTLMILILSNYALSVAMFIGLFVGILGSVLSIFGFSERVKKIQKTGIAFESALRKGLKSGFLPMLDIHAIMLLIGVGVAYFGGVQIAVFGTTLLLYSIISFVFVGVI